MCLCRASLIPGFYSVWECIFFVVIENMGMILLHSTASFAMLGNILIVQVVEYRTIVVKPVAERGYAIARATIANSSFVDITSHMRHVDPKAFEPITFEHELCSPIVLTRGVFCGYYVTGFVALILTML